MTHRLTGHPLFALERLVTLAASLPPASVEYNAGDLARGYEGQPTPGNGLTAEATIRGIEQHNSWMVLQNVEHDPEYRALLQSCLDDLAAGSPALRRRIRQPEAYLFVSSAGAVTPYHMDPEQGFLLQVRGRKRIRLFDGADPRILDAGAIEQFYSGVTHRSMTLPASVVPLGRTFELTEGDGVHVPPTHPHFVEVDGGGYSVSLSVTFRTPDLRRRADIHYFNGFLRSRGFTPARPGASRLTDPAKRVAGRLLRNLRRFKSSSRPKKSY